MMKVAGKYIAKIFSDQDRFTYCGIMIVGLAILVILVSKASSQWKTKKFGTAVHGHMWYICIFICGICSVFISLFLLFVLVCFPV